jgi:hypothetical protein
MSQTAPDPDRSRNEGESMRLLPGPDRRQRPRTYRYRLIYRKPQPKAGGCIMLWEVTGGRLPYQIAWERTAAGASRLHCTCADAIYRGEDARHVCKHVRGLLSMREKNSA